MTTTKYTFDKNYSWEILPREAGAFVAISDQLNTSVYSDTEDALHYIIPNEVIDRFDEGLEDIKHQYDEYISAGGAGPTIIEFYGYEFTLDAPKDWEELMESLDVYIEGMVSALEGKVREVMVHPDPNVDEEDVDVSSLAMKLLIFAGACALSSTVTLCLWYYF